MDRREFLKAAALAGVVAAAPALSCTAQEGANRGKIKKAVKYGMVKEFKTPADKLKLLQDLGFDGVEPGTGEADADALRKASEETGVKVHGVVHGWSLDKIPASIDYAKAVGATSVLVVPDKVGDDLYYDDLYAKSQAVYREVIPHAQEQQIMVLVENVWNNFLISPLEMARYLDEFDSPWVGAYFDVGNVLRYGWSEHWVRALGNRVKKLDIKDYSRKKMEEEGLWNGFKVEIGEGSANWAAVRKELAAINYEGWATAEVDGGGRDRLAQIAAQMDKVLDL